MPVKIIAGKLRGRNITCLEGLEVRPTSSLARAAIFNILQPFAPFHKVLDIYAGCGALGIEALSRGALEVTLVDKGSDQTKLIKDNLTSMKALSNVYVHTCDALEYLGNSEENYDLILADPPYQERCLPAIIKTVDESNCLNKQGVLVVQHSISEKAVDVFGRLELWKSKKYGKTLVTFYRYHTEG